MAMTVVSDILAHVRRLVSQPTEELTRWQRTLKNIIDFARYCAKTMAKDRAPEMAAALTYRTIFSLVPTLIICLLVLRAFYDTQATVESTGEAPQTEVQATQTEAGPPVSRSEEIVRHTLYNWLQLHTLEESALPEAKQAIDNQVRTWMGAYEKLSFKGIASVGLILLIWAALALIVTVEQCFNRVYNSSTGRPWHHRIYIYWSMLTLGPILVTISMIVTGRATESMDALPVVGMLFSWLKGFTALGATFLLLFLLYVLMPATRVNLKPAAVGALTAAILWEIAKWAFKLYVKYSAFSSVYGAVGLIPLFLFWLYLSWLIVLFGLEISYSLQTLGGYQLREQQNRLESQILGDPLWLVPIMAHIAREFAHGGSVDTQTLAEELGLPQRTIARIGQKLEDARLIHRVADTKKNADFCYALAQPPDRIGIAQLLELGRAMNAVGTIKHKDDVDRPVMDRITQAQREAVGQTTLADLIRNV